MLTTISHRTKLRVVKETERSSTTVTIKFNDDTYRRYHNKFQVNLLNKRSSLHSLLSSSATILLVRSANGDAPFQGKFQVNSLNDDTYRWNCATSSYGQIE